MHYNYNKRLITYYNNYNYYNKRLIKTNINAIICNSETKGHSCSPSQKKYS